MERASGGLTSTEICSIIEACGKNGVNHIEVSNNGVKIDLGATSKVLLDDNVPLPNPLGVKAASTTINYTPEQHEELLRLKREEYYSNLKIENPFAYEEMLASGEIEDVQDEQNDRGPE